ncbi:MAG TPA: SCO family protein [Candidatus Avipropionibacterium avicola]|uniref:SCO family protein n=1 Tax=Candidatus Avipropionibacterium avicola TaxID=2840701 RepID=A0A9D1KNS8_9ACTN|nr:SCO family protein [Candidatus Avipropionibacterium avicola]
MQNPYQVPEDSLTDTSGQSYNLSSSPATPVTLVFFGYTHCPDVCITVMSDLAVALKRSEDGVRDRITVAFVTTDPARDDPDTIRSWLDRFDPSFVGLTGDLDVIKDMAEQLGVVVEGMKKLPSGGYEVGHGAQVIGVRQDEGGVIVWTPSTPVGDLRNDLSRLVDES